MNIIPKWWHIVKETLFPWIEKELDLENLTDKQKQLISTLEILDLDSNISSPVPFSVGRPVSNRVKIARAFVAKSVYNLRTTRSLLDRLKTDFALRRLCGWEANFQIPHEATFSRAFDEFSKSELPRRVHDALIKKTVGETILKSVSRDATAIEGREKPLRKKKKEVEQQEVQEEKRLNKQFELLKIEEMNNNDQIPNNIEKRDFNEAVEAMLDDLPKHCDVNRKKNSKGYVNGWTGYKLHMDTTEGDIPISCILTSASVHDSQAAIPLSLMSNNKVTALYELMDAAYDADLIKMVSKMLGHQYIIDPNPRSTAKKIQKEQDLKGRKFLNFEFFQKRIFKQRSSSERANSRLKEDFGGSNVMVKGHSKVFCHLMFGVLALTADQLFKNFV